MVSPPERVVCLTEETVETIYLLGEEDRIVGVSGYAVRPARVRREKPRVSAFTSANFAKILALKPDLVFAFSDLQAEIVATLIREGIQVHAFSQRSVAGILDMMRMVGAILGRPEAGADLAGHLSARLEAKKLEAEALRAGLFRGMGRADDRWNRLGLGDRRGGGEAKSSIILQPGSAALTDGLDAIAEIIRAWASHQPAAADKAP